MCIDDPFVKGCGQACDVPGICVRRRPMVSFVSFYSFCLYVREGGWRDGWCLGGWLANGRDVVRRIRRVQVPRSWIKVRG